MKTLAITLLFVPSLLLAAETEVLTCSPNPATSPDGFGQAVGELGETNSACADEQTLKQQLEAIENQPEIIAQARAEAEVPLEVFGGRGE